MRLKTLATKLYHRLPNFMQAPAVRLYYLAKHKFRIGYPSIIQIEISSDCNRDCWFCWRKFDKTGRRKDKDGHHIRKFMPSGIVLDIIDQAYKLGYTGEVAFHILNEPLLDERIFGFAKYAKIKGMIPSLTTNGDILRKRDDKEYFELLSSCFDRIYIGQYDFSNWEERSQDRINLLRKLHRAKFVDFWGGERQAVRGMDEKMFEKKYEISVADFIKSAQRKPCLAPSYQLIIRYDGKIVGCCAGDEFVTGDISKQSLEEYWFSKEHIDIVKKLRKAGGRKYFEVCWNCPNDGDYPAPIQAAIEREKKEKKDYYYATPLYDPQNSLNPNYPKNNKIESPNT